MLDLPKVGDIWENVYLQRNRMETVRFPTVVLVDAFPISEQEYFFDGFCLTRKEVQRYVIGTNNFYWWVKLA